MKRNLMNPTCSISTAPAPSDRRIGRLFEDLLDSWSPVHAGRGLGALDIVERPDEFLLTIDLPGVADSDLDLQVEDGVLTLSAARERAELGEGEVSRTAERTFGRFSRRLRLPRDVKQDGIQANLDAGVLTVSLPKAESAKPRQIQIHRG